MAQQGLLVTNKATTPCNRHPRLARTDSPAYRSHLRNPPPSPGNLSRNSAADSTLAGDAQSSPGNWVDAGAPRTVDTRCPRRPASDRLAHEGSACLPAYASAFQAPVSGTWGRGSASLGSRTPAPGSPSSRASLIDTWSRRFCSSRVFFDAFPRPLVSTENISSNL